MRSTTFFEPGIVSSHLSDLAALIPTYDRPIPPLHDLIVRLIQISTLLHLDQSSRDRLAILIQHPRQSAIWKPRLFK